MKYVDIETATKLPVGWLNSFATGQTKNPSVNRIETLYTYLSGKELSL